MVVARSVAIERNELVHVSYGRVLSLRRVVVLWRVLDVAVLRGAIHAFVVMTSRDWTI